MNNKKQVFYSMSANGFDDGKSVCLWRTVGNKETKIARFQSDEAAKIFAEEFNFPLDNNLKERLNRR